MSSDINEIEDLKALKDKIKKMETEQRVPSLNKDKLVSFDSWFHQRKDVIPKHHMKEVIMADFKARGLDKEATTEQYDKALRMYGIKI
jgi:hypothetical protein